MLNDSRSVLVFSVLTLDIIGVSFFGVHVIVVGLSGSGGIVLRLAVIAVLVLLALADVVLAILLAAHVVVLVPILVLIVIVIVVLSSCIVYTPCPYVSGLRLGSLLGE